MAFQYEIDFARVGVHRSNAHLNFVAQAVGFAGGATFQAVTGFVVFKIVLSQFRDMQQAVDKYVVERDECAKLGDR